MIKGTNTTFKTNTPNTNHVKKVNTTSTNELTPPQTTSCSIVHSTQQWVEVSKSTIVEIDFGPMVIAKEMGRVATIPLTNSHYNPFNGY
jgi:hypothetical protein